MALYIPHRLHRHYIHPHHCRYTSRECQQFLPKFLQLDLRFLKFLHSGLLATSNTFSCPNSALRKSNLMPFFTLGELKDPRGKYASRLGGNAWGSWGCKVPQVRVECHTIVDWEGSDQEIQAAVQISRSWDVVRPLRDTWYDSVFSTHPSLQVFQQNFWVGWSDSRVL